MIYGNRQKIKQLRLRRGVTQEAMAHQINVTAQAVSKWERGITTPDISMLPDISAYFGVTIDELFSISDQTHMERIRNMLWDNRYLDLNEVEATRAFLVEKGRKEPSNGTVYEMLALKKSWVNNQCAVPRLEQRILFMF